MKNFFFFSTIAIILLLLSVLLVLSGEDGGLYLMFVGFYATYIAINEGYKAQKP